MKDVLSNTKSYRVVSLFSGCGGMDLGFVGGFRFLEHEYPRLPFDIEWANDIDAFACKTYRGNIGPEILCDDIAKVIADAPMGADVVIGGFPCQDISINGLRRGLDGTRSGLYRHMVEVIEQTRPKVFIVENVKGLLQQYSRDALHQLLTDFGGLGYEVTYSLYLAADYGVPQSRERVFLVGTQPGLPRFLPPAPLDARWVTTAGAIADLEERPEDLEFNHIWSKAKASRDQGMRILKANRPSDTIRAEHHGNIQFHYRLPRRISLREAARLQSFPDNFRFSGGMRSIERQIGNAVPPVLAWHIARAALRCLQGTDVPMVASPVQEHQLALAKA